MLNARIRKRWRMGNFPIGLIGESADLTYSYEHLGTGPQTLADIAAGRHGFSEALKQAQNPMVIVGMAALARPDGAAVASLAAQVATKLRFRRLERVLRPAYGGLARGCARYGVYAGSRRMDSAGHGSAFALDVIFLLGADEIDVAPGAFVVYIGTHGDQGARRADVILPGAAYPEKSGFYVNTEGRVQIANRASFPPGEAREDWAILRALSDVLGRRLPYDSLPFLRQALFKAHPHVQRVDHVSPGARADIAALAARGGSLEKLPFVSAVATSTSPMRLHGPHRSWRNVRH